MAQSAITLQRPFDAILPVFNLSQEHEMGITLSALEALATPLQQFANWLASTPPQKLSQAGPARSATPTSVKRPRTRYDLSRPSSARSSLPTRRPLRVVRVLDGGHPSATAGRMVISGRMAEVCAELDRLAAMEPDQALAPIR